jgi:hypothetical protein
MKVPLCSAPLLSLPDCLEFEECSGLLDIDQKFPAFCIRTESVDHKCIQRVTNHALYPCNCMISLSINSMKNGLQLAAMILIRVSGYICPK